MMLKISRRPQALEKGIIAVLARMLEMPPHTLRSYAKGHRNAKYATSVRLAEITGTSPDLWMDRGDRAKAKSERMAVLESLRLGISRPSGENGASR
jgi:plasmid maintenance system antidote protein VapI